jgi:hypothetical protein
MPSWKATADVIDRLVKEGRAEVLDDLKAKLNWVQRGLSCVCA